MKCSEFYEGNGTSACRKPIFYAPCGGVSVCVCCALVHADMLTETCSVRAEAATTAMQKAFKIIQSRVAALSLPLFDRHCCKDLRKVYSPRHLLWAYKLSVRGPRYLLCVVSASYVCLFLSLCVCFQCAKDSVVTSHFVVLVPGGVASIAAVSAPHNARQQQR